MAPESRNYDVEPIFQEIPTTTSTTLDQFIPPPHILILYFNYYFITNSFAGFPTKQPQNEQHTRPPQSYISGHETCHIQAIGTIDWSRFRELRRRCSVGKPKCKQPNVCHEFAEKIYFSQNHNFAVRRSLFDHPKMGDQI